MTLQLEIKGIASMAIQNQQRTAALCDMFVITSQKKILSLVSMCKSENQKNVPREIWHSSVKQGKLNTAARVYKKTKTFF